MTPSIRDRASLAPILVAPFLLIAGCGGKDTDQSGRANPERQVAVVLATKGNVVEVMRLTGTLAAVQEVEITSKIPGRVEQVLVEEGTPVKPRKALIHLETTESALSVKKAEAAVALGKANLADAKNDHSRMKKLFEEEAIPRKQWEKAEVALKVATAQLEQAKASLALAKEQLDDAVIRSPIKGVVAHRDVEPGEVVFPPMIPGKALLHIVDASTLKTQVNVSQNRVKAVRLGQEAVITLDGFPDETFPGRVSKISPVVDTRSRTFEAEILIPNPDGRMKPGMFARVRLVLAKRTDIVKVPLKAVVEGEKGEVVFVAVNGVARARPVTLGIADGVDVEVVSGVNVGDKVIIRGNVGLEDGDRIILRSPSREPMSEHPLGG